MTKSLPQHIEKVNNMDEMNSKQLEEFKDDLRQKGFDRRVIRFLCRNGKVAKKHFDQLWKGKEVKTPFGNITPTVNKRTFKLDDSQKITFTEKEQPDFTKRTPLGKRKKVTSSFQIDPDTHNKLKQIAYEEGCSISKIVQRAVQSELRKLERKRDK
jgi:hypothetical protein